jgi:FkbM family methyltransferase
MNTPTRKQLRDDHLAQLKAIANTEQTARPDFAQMINALALHVPVDLLAPFVARVTALAESAGPVPLGALLDVLIEGDRIMLWQAALQFQSRAALETIAEEILIHQEYHFRSAQPAPVVIDAGANIGLATYYARRMCKAGKVICFEPNPETFAVLSANAKAGKWDNTELHNAAVAATDGEAEFAVMAGAPLAASMAPRNTDKITGHIKVPTLKLRPFLKEPVGLLKIDIEGAEADVLEACADALGLVENIFVEVHPVHGEVPGLLVRVLAVLENAGFMVHVARSPWSHHAHSNRPLTQAHRTYSLSVYGTRLTP